ncbi:hypothetical protein IB024_00930 [Brucella sp. 6810]|uniref:hypothetical protein n=1 Tax=Brucella sp. 6810 TaxID=2769351 RepID=UPI00165C8DDA|nr:hypothetical protein [Brucella sp. 6810]QNQ62357.1 hypothetical protein IB024_00930 [Brucella sp. 6810]
MGLLERWAISWALRKRSPERIPTSDLAAMRRRNYYTVYLRDDSGAVRFVITEQDKANYIGNKFSDADTEINQSISKSDLSSYKLYIIHYYGEIEINYYSAIAFFLGLIARVAFFKLRIDRIIRFIYGNMPLTRKSRIEILRYAIDHGIVFGRQIHVMDLLRSIHGDRLRYVDKHWPLYLYYKALLDSLRSELTLDKGADSYTVNPKAIATLDRYESEERRHRQAIRTQMLLVVLTFVIALTGLAPYSDEISAFALSQYSEMSKSFADAQRALVEYCAQ